MERRKKRKLEKSKNKNQTHWIASSMYKCPDLGAISTNKNSLKFFSLHIVAGHPEALELACFEKLPRGFSKQSLSGLFSLPTQPI